MRNGWDDHDDAYRPLIVIRDSSLTVGDGTNARKGSDADGGDDADRNAVNASNPKPMVGVEEDRGVVHDTQHLHAHGASRHTGLCSVGHGDDGDSKDPSSDGGDGGPTWQPHNRTIDDAAGPVSTADGGRQRLLLRPLLLRLPIRTLPCR